MRRTTIAGAAVGLAGAAAATRVVRGRHPTPTHRPDPHRPADVGFMMAIHDALRRDVDRLRGAPLADEPVAPTVREGWSLLRRELVFHHQAEDDDLWPVLRRRLSEPADLAAVDAMVAEHARMPAALDAVEGAMGRPAVVAAVDQLSTLLLDHLRHEEEAALPLVRRHLSDADWHRFLMLERAKRPRRERAAFLMWVLDDASDDDAQAVLQELPPPGRAVYRNVLRRVHEHRHLWRAEEGLPG